MAHILVVDDEVYIRLLLRTLLKSAGHSVAEAQDGRAALDLLAASARRFDMIILDLLMPRMGGVEFIATLRRQTPYAPILILTAHQNPIPASAAYQVSGQLSKPFDRRGLIDMVNKLLATYTCPS